MDALANSQVVLAVVEHDNGIVEQRINDKGWIIQTLEPDVIRVTFPLILHNAN